MPNSRASRVAPIAASIELPTALRIPASLNAFTYQSTVNEVIGQVATFAALNEYRTMIPIGT